MKRLMRENFRFFLLSILTLIVGASSIFSCGNEKERAETITKLRALGVAQSPTVGKPGDTVTLTFYLAGPSQMTLTATPLLDQAARYGEPVMVTPIDASPSESVVGSLSLYTYKAQFTAPSSPTTLAAIAGKGYARIRYNVKFTGTDNDAESIVGDTLVYPAGSAQLSWQAPTISISKPSGTTTAGSVNLEGVIHSNGNESNRVSWFVSAGKVKNRRAKTTEWQDVPTGNQAVFFTVRGAKSGAFAIESRAISLN